MHQSREEKTLKHSTQPLMEFKAPYETSGRQIDSPVIIRSASLTGIFFLLLMFTLYFASPLLIPITLALVLNLILTPLARIMSRLSIPRPLSAAVIVIAMLGLSMNALYALSEPAQQWLEKAPQGLIKLEEQLKVIEKPIEQIKETQKKVDQLTSLDTKNTRLEAARGDSFSIVKMVLSGAPTALFGISVTLILLFFLLASGDLFLRKLVKVMPKFKDKKNTVETIREIQNRMATYLGIITLINITLGSACALALYLLGVPNPVLWGAMIAMLNYIPYFGPFASILVILLVSLITFDSTLSILLPPGAVLLLTSLEGQILTPVIAGNRLQISPVAIFLTLVIMGWMWGIVGALLAVPLLACIKIVGEHIACFRPASEFLSASER